MGSFQNVKPQIKPESPHYSGFSDGTNEMKIHSDRQAQGTQTENSLKGGHFASTSITPAGSP